MGLRCPTLRGYEKPLACGVAGRSCVTALERELRERREFQNRRLEWCDALRLNGFQQIFEVFGGNTP